MKPAIPRESIASDGTTGGGSGEAARRGVPTRVGTYEASGLGTLWIGLSEKGLCRIEWMEPTDLAFTSAERGPLPEALVAALDRYFRGEPESFEGIDLDLAGTDFQREVWGALSAIPHGAVRTYGGVAADIGSPRAMRAVGLANGKNPVPIVVPCHRVVEAGNRLGGYGGGLERKRFLLQLEGCRVEDGVVHPGQLTLF